MSLPNVEVVRGQIENVRREDVRFCLMATYLFCGRISEVVGRATLGDKETTPRGPKGTDVRLDYFIQAPLREKAVIFDVHTAKRKGMIRKIGLPTRYEPWAKPLYEYFKQAGNEVVFPLTRQKVWAFSKQAFEGLTYPIETYTIWRDGQLVKKVDEHTRPFRLHALRHLRTSELVERYGFGGFNLAAYAGWTITTAQAQFGVNVPRVISRYLYLNWQGYFPKLLKKRM